MSSIRNAGILASVMGILIVRGELPGQNRTGPMPDFELPAASPRVHGLAGRVLSATAR